MDCFLKYFSCVFTEIFILKGISPALCAHLSETHGPWTYVEIAEQSLCSHAAVPPPMGPAASLKWICIRFSGKV